MNAMHYSGDFLPDWTTPREEPPMAPQLNVRERTARARPQRYQREPQPLAEWCSQHLASWQLAQLQACQQVRAGASEHYARHGWRCSQETTMPEYRLAVTIASGAGISFDDAADFVCMRR